MIYNKESLRQLFQQKFNLDRWYSLLIDFFEATELKTNAEKIIGANIGEQGYYLGSIKTKDNYCIGLLYYDINDSDVIRKKIGLRNLVKSFINPQWGEFDAALVVFDSKKNWRLSFICDIRGESTAVKRYTYVFGEAENYYNTPVTRFYDLQQRGISFENIRETFSVESLSRDFYNKLYNWYQWALSNEAGVTFPNNPNVIEDDRELINVKLIRLITRLLFVWFIKQKQLIPNNLFELNFLKSILSEFDGKSKDCGNYYNAILQNLFFATLNCAIIDEDGNPRRFAVAKGNRDTRNLYRYTEMFSISENEILQIFAKIPFLNGGLFECLDKPKDLYLDLDHDILFDGFSRNATKAPNGNYKYRAFVPNILFFNDDENQPGLINLLNQYNFTMEENSPNDAVVSLDPELLGRVFENLLAAYNPETQESARKSTGSFYTPREIVDYMVDESLITYILGKNIEGIEDYQLRELFHTHTLTDYWTTFKANEITSALKSIKILDPACGSGAFPMGCLLRIVDIIELINHNKINRYQLKLDIIENCVFGVDIQPIAMLICKLRFFISLICEQNNINFNSPQSNFGINTLPNLETKFVAANTLLSANIRQYNNDWTADEHLKEQQKILLDIRNQHFMAKGRNGKLQSQKQDKIKRDEILAYIIDSTSKPNQERIDLWTAEIKRLKREADKYKNEVWVDSTKKPEITLFGVIESPEAVFRIDINEKRRNEIRSLIKTIEYNIKKEQEKGALRGFEAAIKQITDWDPYDQNSISPFFDPEWMFCLKTKFDIVIGNPPYISTKGVKESDKKLYEKEFGFSDDTYNLFTFKGLSLCKENGTLTFITPKTFWTTQTKRNMRDLILSKNINYIFDTANPFKAAMVDTCITQIQNKPMSMGHKIRFFDGTKDLMNPIVFESIKQSTYVNTQNSVIFKPTELNLRIYELYGEKVKSLYDKWWDKIKTSRDIEKNKTELEEYRASLKPGDIALLGCLTEGGQGLATANNGKYIAVRKSTKWAANIITSRPKKLAEAIIKKKVIISKLEDFADEKEFLSSLSEKEIAALFDNIKERYGRDIFGQGYIYKLIDDSEIADVDSLTEDEKENGIDTSKNYYVPYDKGDKDGNRWYLETPFAIAWSKENVRFLKTDPKARYQGYAFYFKEGFCWNNVLTTYIKCKKKKKTVQSTESMSLFSCAKVAPENYLITIMNSRFSALYIDNFINSTSHCTTGDAKLLLIKIPTQQELIICNNLFLKAYYLKESVAEEYITDADIYNNLSDIENKVDNFINQLYGINEL